MNPAALELRFNGARAFLPLPSFEWTGSVTINLHQGRFTERGHRRIETRYACRKCGGAEVTAYELTDHPPAQPFS